MLRFYLIFRSSQFLCIGKIVNGNGQENIEQGVVTEQRQHNEVQRVDHARPGNNMKPHATIQTVRERYSSRREKIFKKLV